MTCVLIVEDEPTVRRAVARAFRASGWDVTQAETLRSARESVSQRDIPFDCVVLDLELPDGSGLQLAEELRQSDLGVQLVFFSGTDDPELLSAASGMALSVHKSEGIRTLVEHVLELMRPPTRSQAFLVAASEPKRSSGT
ncbi:MAG: response regulator [Polyangiaceae bacterium]|nr:response regulator [Myxococcales bacterium]MCB9586545.1 response regulator [Polyangiaceae bacterium]MCB9606052.1 response regulator [Polyangiaceae bacterium]